MNCPRCGGEMLEGEAVMHHSAAFAWQTLFTGVSYKRLYFRPNSDSLTTMLLQSDEWNGQQRGDILILRSDGRSGAFYCLKCRGTFVE